MSIKVTNKMVKVHTDFFDFNPRWKLESAEYEKATMKSGDEKPQKKYSTRDKQEVIKRAGDLGAPLEHWPYFPTTDEIDYYNFLDKITDKKNRFNPARDEDKRPIKEGIGKGACHVITDIIRLKTAEKGEVLLSKGHIIGHDDKGQEQTHPLPWPERWFKTLFKWDSDFCLGPQQVEVQYLLEFNKQNAKELFDQRANDTIINFVVKDEVSDKAKKVEPDVNAQKTFERFANNSFEFLWIGEYIPLPVRQELRQEAVARGDIRGGAGDYQMTAQPAKAGSKNAYQ